MYSPWVNNVLSIIVGLVVVVNVVSVEDGWGRRILIDDVALWYVFRKRILDVDRCGVT